MSKFISCDWGTSALRLRLVDSDTITILAEIESSYGIVATHELWKINGQRQDERLDIYQSVLQDHLKMLEGKTGTTVQNMPVIISGMASSSIGMMELPYKEIPFNMDGSDLEIKMISAADLFRNDICLISGVKTTDDVMRGEETQLIGCYDATGAGSQFFIFTGTHSKHVTIKEGKAIDIKTYMTGELFYLFSKKSILSNDIAAPAELIDEENDENFKKGIEDSIGLNLLNSLFKVRINSLLGKTSKKENFFYLNGLLIGCELKEITGITIPLTVVGNERLIKMYKDVANKLGITQIESIDSGKAIITGHSKIYKTILKKIDKGTKK